MKRGIYPKKTAEKMTPAMARPLMYIVWEAELSSVALAPPAVLAGELAFTVVRLPLAPVVAAGAACEGRAGD